ncbi:MAG: hypothetical protein R2865_04325 [Deinococcales bacterium]
MMALAAVAEVIPDAELYDISGIQFIQLNSLYQLFSMVKSQDPALKVLKIH